jgi:molybdenum cofactor cytidylyltransferase
MGQPKQLLRWRGETLLQHVVDTVHRSSVSEIVIVLGSAADEVLATLKVPPNARAVVNPAYRDGQGGSLRVGLAEARDADGALIVLADEPDIDAAAIDLVLARWRKGERPIARAIYEGRPGHPVLLGRTVWAELPGEGDEGARSLIERRPDLVEDVEVPLPRPKDVDTPRDLDDLLASSAPDE